MGGINKYDTKVEGFKENWVDLGEIPHSFANKLWYFSTVTLERDLYVFGGDVGTRETDEVFKLSGSFDSIKWQLLETRLAKSRFGHRSILRENSIFHIGGPEYRFVI